MYNKNTGNMAVYNKNTNSYSTYHYNTNGTNGYYYHGRVVVNPVYYPAWGWNRGVVWAPYGAYWGGGFWGPFAVGAATAAIMGSVVYANQTYPSYSVHTGSPGAILLSNYGLRQVPCGPPGLVVIYGPNFGVICAYPNGRVAAGSYAVNTNSAHAAITVVMVAPAAITTTASAQRAPSSATHAPPVPGLNVHNGAPTGVAPSGNAPVVHNQAAANTAAFNKITGTVVNTSTVVTPRVIVNPAYFGPAWGWNQGIVWMPQGAYWGGGFYGPFGPGAATTAEIMGSIIYGNQTYPSYGVSSNSPGALLLSSYGLRQVPCGPPGLVVIYGPTSGVICTYPNARVAPGNYAVNTDTLTLHAR